MQFDERAAGDYRIYAGAIEGPTGDGYLASVIVRRVHGLSSGARDAFRDESLAGGHRWPSAHEALVYAVTKGLEVIRAGGPVLRC